MINLQQSATGQPPLQIQQEESSIEIYKENIGTFLLSNRLDYQVVRAVTYINESTGSMNEILEKSIVPVSLTVPPCAIIGGGIGFGIGGIVTWYWPVISWIGPLIGGTIGVSLGTAIGGTASSVLTTIRIQNSDHYMDWKQQLIDVKVYNTFKDYLSKDLILQSCLCPISLDIMMVPVKAPDGLVYEQEEILSWIKNKREDSAASIYREIDFGENDLLFDKEVFMKTAKRISYLLKTDITNLSKEGIVPQALTQYMQMRKTKYRDILNKVSEISRELRRDAKIDKQQYQVMQEELFQMEEELFRQEN